MFQSIINGIQFSYDKVFKAVAILMYATFDVAHFSHYVYQHSVYHLQVCTVLEIMKNIFRNRKLSVKEKMFKPLMQTIIKFYTYYVFLNV